MTSTALAALVPFRSTVERKIAAVLVLAVGVFGLFGLTSVLSTRSLIAQADWVAHTHLVLEQLERVLADLGRLESDQRGYLLTGDASYLTVGRGDDEPIERTLATLAALVADNPRQARLAQRLTPKALRRVAMRDEVLALYRRAGLDAAIAMLRRNRGRHLMVNVRLLVERMRRSERRLLAERSARADRHATRTLRTITTGSVMALLILAAMSVRIRRDLRAGEATAEALAQVSERFNLALAAAQVGTWSWDLAGDVIVWDDYVHPLFGLSAGNFGGGSRELLALIHPDDREALTRAVRRALADGGDLASEYRVRWPDGSEHVIALRGETYRDAGGMPSRLTGVCWDATEERDARENLRRTKEAADAANAAKSEFLTSMSHELRTPMNSIIGFSQLLLRSAKSRLDEEDRDALQTVQRNAHHLLTLINQVLDLSRVEAGKVTLAKTRLDLAILVREVVQDARPLVGGKPLRLLIETPGQPVEVEVDATRIRQIVTNLTANAVKYTEAGTVTVRLTAEHDPQIGAAVRVRIVDTGPGISAEDQARLFQRFTRLDTDATRREGGTGLGLSLSQELARMHGGRIEVRSDGRTGSEFALTLPAGRRRATPADVACVGAGAGADDGAFTVLVVDDDPDVLVLLERALREAGYRVLLAGGAREAMARAADAEPDLVCIDGDLPRDDGFVLIRGLRGHPVLACVPVIMLGGDASEARVIAGGARRHLPKPTDPEALVRAVGNVLGARVALVLVVDADEDVRTWTRMVFELQGIGVALAADGAAGIARLREERPDVVVLDPRATPTEGGDLLEVLLYEPAWQDIPLVVLTRDAVDPGIGERLAARQAIVLDKAEDGVAALVRAVTERVAPPALPPPSAFVRAAS